MRIPDHIRRRLAILTAAFLLSGAVLGVVYLRIPEAMGMGRYDASVEFKEGAGLYDGAEVIYRGVPIGKVTELSLQRGRITAHVSLRSAVKVPADVTAAIRSRSAVGEQYIDLLDPASQSPTTLAAGSVIPLARTSQPVEIGPLLDNAHALAQSLNAEDVNTAVTELGKALNGRSTDLQAIIDHGASFADQAYANIEPTTRLINDTAPLLKKVNGEERSIRELTASLSDVTKELRKGDKDLRRLLSEGPAAGREVAALLVDLDERLPAVLGPLQVVTNILVAYDVHLDATLAKYPRSMASIQSVSLSGTDPNKVRFALGDFNNPAECVKGFLPVSQWLSPFEEAPETLPPLMYCKEDHEDPRGYRGARNIPCPTNPAIRSGEASACPMRKPK